MPGLNAPPPGAPFRVPGPVGLVEWLTLHNARGSDAVIRRNYRREVGRNDGVKYRTSPVDTADPITCLGDGGSRTER